MIKLSEFIIKTKKEFQRAIFSLFYNMILPQMQESGKQLLQGTYFDD